MLIYTHEECLLKNNGLNHPERKERLSSILKSIKQMENIEFIFKDAPLADMDTISLVHPKKYVENIFLNIPKTGLIGVEKEPYADTMLCHVPFVLSYIMTPMQQAVPDCPPKSNAVDEIKPQRTTKSRTMKAVKTCGEWYARAQPLQDTAEDRHHPLRCRMKIK